MDDKRRRSLDRSSRPTTPGTPAARDEEKSGRVTDLAAPGSVPGQPGDLEELIFDYLAGDIAPSGTIITPARRSTQEMRAAGPKGRRTTEVVAGRPVAPTPPMPAAPARAPAGGAAPKARDRAPAGNFQQPPYETSDFDGRDVKTDPDILRTVGVAPPPAEPPGRPPGYWPAGAGPSQGAPRRPPDEGAPTLVMERRAARVHHANDAVGDAVEPAYHPDPAHAIDAHDAVAAVPPDVDFEGRPTVQMQSVFDADIESEESEGPVPGPTSSSLLVVGERVTDNVRIAYHGILVSSSTSQEITPRAVNPMQLPPPPPTRVDDDDPELGFQSGPELGFQPSPRRPRRLELDPRLVVRVQPTSPVAAAYRALRDSLLARGLPKVLAVTSANDGDGKTTTAANLTLALAEIPDLRVLVLEAQHRTADLARIFGIMPPDPSDGRGESRTRPYDVVKFDDSIDIGCIHAGTDAGIPAFDRRSFAAALALFRLGKYDCILFDCDSLAGSGNTQSVIEASDAVLLVARAGRTPARAIRRASQAVGKERLVGLSLIEAPLRRAT